MLTRTHTRHCKSHTYPVCQCETRCSHGSAQLAAPAVQMTPEMVTCTWVQCLCFVRRAQSLKDARQTFLKASKVPDIGWQVCPATPVSSLHAMSCSSLGTPAAHGLSVSHILDSSFDSPILEPSCRRGALHLSELHVRILLSRYPVGASLSLV